MKCLGQHQSQTAPRQGRCDGRWPNGEQMRWRRLAQELSLASRAECRTIRADPFGLSALSFCLVSLVFCASSASSAALYHRAAPEHPSTRVTAAAAYSVTTVELR